MRVLISCCPLYGHANTVLTLAQAAQRAGHQVVVATGPDLVPYVEEHGVPAWPVGPTHAEAGGGRTTDWVAYFIATAGPRAQDLVPRARAWAPDVVVHEETELAGAVAGAVVGAGTGTGIGTGIGTRHVVHGLGLMPSVGIWQAFGPGLDRLGGLFDVPALADRVRDAAYLHVCPPALRPVQEPIWSTTLPLRPTTGTAGPGERLPDAIESMPYKRTVHLTLGTVFHGATDVLTTTIAGLRDLPVNLVVTSGPGTDPGRFGPQPPNVLIEPYLPHALLLPRCDLVVGQGGAGVMFGALIHGLPQLALPQGAEQFLNAEACVEAGAALTLAPDEVTAAAVTAAASRLLDELSFTAAARAVQAEIEAMPSADEVLATLARADPA